MGFLADIGGLAEVAQIGATGIVTLFVLFGFLGLWIPRRTFNSFARLAEARVADSQQQVSALKDVNAVWQEAYQNEKESRTQLDAVLSQIIADKDQQQFAVRELLAIVKQVQSDKGGGIDA